MLYNIKTNCKPYLNAVYQKKSAVHQNAIEITWIIIYSLGYVR